MNRRDSANIAREMAGFWAAARETSGESRDDGRIHGATFDQAFEFIPEDAAVALIQRPGNNAPLVAAFKAPTLYLLEVLKHEDNLFQPPTNCCLVHVAPGRGAVEVETRYRREQVPVDDARPPRTASWRFKFDDGTEIKIETFRGTEGEVDAREALAQRLAAALGWEMDLPATEYGLEAA
jgi:hypothetical protein